MTIHQDAAVDQDVRHFQVPVIYNGETKLIDANSHQQTNALLEHAIHQFHVTNQPHLLSLFREDGTRVEDNQSLAQADINADTTLQLRPDAVKGGHYC